MLFVRLKEVERNGLNGFHESVPDVGDEIYQQREELDSLRQQMNSESEALRRLRAEYDSVQREMEMLLEVIDKRHQLLDSLDSELDSEITARRHDIEVQSVISYLLFYIWTCRWAQRRSYSAFSWVSTEMGDCRYTIWVFNQATQVNSARSSLCG